MKKRLLITGGLGYLGSLLAEHFRRRGHAVRILTDADVTGLRAWQKRFELVRCDITRPRRLKEALRQIDCVLHLACINEAAAGKDPARDLMVNAYGTRNLLAACAAHGVPDFLYFSTFLVYGRFAGAIDEETPPQPVGDYALTRLFGEYYCRHFHGTGQVNSVVFRLTNVYGAPLARDINRWTTLINGLCRMAVSEGRIRLKSSGRQYRDFVSHEDVARATEIVLDRFATCRGNTYNVGGGRSVRVKDVAALIAREYARRSGRARRLPIVTPAGPGAAAAGRAARLDVDISRLRRLGYEPRDRMRDEVNRLFNLLDAS